MKIYLESARIMKNDFNDNADPRPHHYILKLSRTAGADRAGNPGDKARPAFQQGVLFQKRLQKWAADKGQTDMLKSEILPLSEEGRPRLRLACPPAMMEEINDLFARDIRQVDEIPLPEPSRQKKSIWKLIFGG